MMIWMIPLLVLIAILASVPSIMERRKAPVDRQMRAQSDQSFVKLSKGVTAYKWHGPVRGPVIVAVHGLGTPSAVWDDLIPELPQIGYRVLTYDLYGRGLSDAPDGKQTAAFFQRQLDDLLVHQGLEEDVTLLGYSMGGSIVTGYASIKTHKISKIILMCSAGVRVNETTLDQMCRRIPVLGDWVSKLVMPGQLRKDIDRSANAHPLHAVRAAQIDQRGYVPSLVSSRRHQLADVQKPEHRIIGRTDIPVFAVWGGDDQVIPVSALGRLAQWNRNAHQEVIEGAGHDVIQTHTAEVGAVLRKMLAG